MNRTLRVFETVGLRLSARRITPLPLRRPPTQLPKLRTRARFLADSSASKPNAGKQRLSTHALSSEAAASSSRAGAGAAEDPIAKEKTLSGRLKALMKTYGWYAVVIYGVVGVIDFSIAFALIQVLGKEKVTKVTDYLKEKTLALLGDWWPQKAHDEDVKEAVEVASGAKAGEVVEKKGNTGVWAAVVLAYGIHKTIFLPFRIGIVAGITPPVVKWLQARGWAGVQGTRRAAEAARAKIQQQRVNRK